MRWVFLAFVLLAWPALAGPPSLPDTSTAVGRAATFVYNWTPSQYATQLGTRQVIWSNQPGNAQGGPYAVYIPPGSVSSEYSAVNRIPDHQEQYGAVTVPTGCGGNCTLAWFQLNHPDWIIYQGDQLTPAYEFSNTTWIPLDISNPAVQAFFKANYYAPVLATSKYNALSVDNVYDQNIWDEEGTCSIKPTTGCTADGGTWTQIYTGATVDPTFVSNRVAWLFAITAYAHGASAWTIANITYDSAHQNDTTSLILSADIWYDEQGFNGDASPATCQAGGGTTYHIYDTSWTGKVAFINGLNSGAGWPMVQEAALCPPDTPRRRVVEYVTAAYCLTNMGHTWIAPYSLTPSDFSDQTPQAQWPDLYQVPGAAIDPRPISSDGNGVWHRQTKNMECVVNPSSTVTKTFTLPAGQWHDIDGTPYSGTISLPPLTALTLRSGASPGVVPVP